MKTKAPVKVMVFGAVASDGNVMPPFIIPTGVTLTAALYQQLVLVQLIMWMNEMWPQGQAVLQQNGALAHTARKTQQYLRDQLGNNFWPKGGWPPSSPDCKIQWGAGCSCTSISGNTCNIQICIGKEDRDSWDIVLTPNFVKKSCAAAWERLSAVVDANGDHIEI